MTRKMILGTRTSDLAMAQSREVAARLEAAHPGLAVEFKTFQTAGDKYLDADLRELAGADGVLEKGLFTRELELALLDGGIDIAVHSLKDLPTTLPPRLAVAAVLEREKTADVLVSLCPGGLDALPSGAIVHTGSERRRLQLLAARNDLSTGGLRGNVPTRLRKLALGKAGDAIILAAAGLRRLGLPSNGPLTFESSTLHLSPLDAVMLPAVGQGIIGIECRADAASTRRLLQAIHHTPTALAARAERALLRTLGGGCQMPLGVTTKLSATGRTLHMRAVLFQAPRPEAAVYAEADGPATAPVRLARRIAHQLKRAS